MTLPPSERRRPPREAAPAITGQEITVSVPRIGLRQAAMNADQWWWSCGWSAVKALAASGRPFTIEDVRGLGIPEPDCPQRYGALIAAAVKSGRIAPAGAVIGANGKALRRWVGEVE